MALSAEGNGSAAPSAENPDPDRSADLEEGQLEVENGEPDATRPGRPPATSAEEIARIALLLFDERGFDDTTVDDIARAAGIGRRTFFRYFTSKNEVPWGDFDGELRRMRDWLRAAPVDQSAASVLHDAILGFNRYPDEELVWHRKRMALILRTPALQAYSTLRYAAWREVIAEFVATRLGVPASDLVPQAVGYACLGGCVAAYEQWLEEDGAELTAVLDRALTMLISGLASIE
jgi:TetR/AcrR family transcriptional regulator, regulator of mycofactocin system